MRVTVVALYLSDMLGAAGGAEEASRARVRCSWTKFREHASLASVLTSRCASLKVKRKLCRACNRSILGYGSEAWAVEVEEMVRLERMERMMVRCGFRLNMASTELDSCLGITDIAVM